MIKILYTINYYSNNGPSKVLKNIMLNLNQKKYDITLLTFTSGDNQKCIDELKNNNIKVIQMNTKRTYLKAFINIKKAINKINEIKPDIIHANGIYNGLIISSKRIKTKKVFTVHHNMFEDLINTYGKIKGNLMLLCQLTFLKKYDSVIGCSKNVYDSFKKYFKKSTYINNGVTPPVCACNNDLRQQLNIPQNAVVYIYCGHLNVHKRILELFELMKKSLNKNEYFIILGDGIYYDYLLKNANKNIKVLGFKTNVIDYLSISDVYVSNSDSEGFSTSVIEALSQGLCLLLSGIESHKNIFEIKPDIYIGEYFNDNFIEKKVIVYNKVKKIDKNKIKQFQDKYLSSKTMTKEYEKCYEKIISNQQ